MDKFVCNFGMNHVNGDNYNTVKLAGDPSTLENKFVVS